MVVSRGHDSLPAGGHGLVLVWMITAHESRTVASYRKNSSTEPGLDFEVVLEGDRDAFAVRNRPRSEGNRHMYNQALILMRCVVAAEEYSMALHPLPLIPVSSQRSLRLPRANRAPLLHAGPLRPVIDGLLANNPAERLTGERARMALLDVQQHKHRLRAGSAEREEQLRCWVLELDDETLQEFA
jgi:hypothetical protein